MKKILGLYFFFFNLVAHASNCENQSLIQNKLMYFARQEAIIAGIPQYKAGMFVDKAASKDDSRNALELIRKYKLVHNKVMLDDEQIKKITEIELQKNNYKKGIVLCK